MKKLMTIVALTLGMILAFNASADGDKQRPEPPSFTEIDSDADQLISREEMEAAMEARVGDRAPRRGGGRDPEGRFNRVDEDGDGYLNEAEFDAARARMDERRGRHHRRGDCDEQDTDA
jgi:hypothetical protein